MLAESAIALGISCKVFSDDPESPAAQIGVPTIQGSFKDVSALRSFLSTVQTVVFENEFLDCHILRQASAGLQVQFRPNLEVIELIQDKLRQKTFLNEQKIFTAPFESLPDGEDLSEWISTVRRKLGPIVFKWARNGYDGKGVLICDEQTPESKILAFCKKALERGSAVYAEKRISFKRELALVASFSVTREFVAYPLVISEQKDGICYRVYGPAKNLGISPIQEAKAQETASKIASVLNLTGTFAVEFFETSSGELIVNEIAPRVHNSGHYTMDACETSQFENHWRAILGMKLKRAQSTAVFCMLNLLGPEGVATRATPDMIPVENSPNMVVHWYGKKEIRPHRKLGHINVFSDNEKDLHQFLTTLDQTNDHWIQTLLGKGSKK